MFKLKILTAVLLFVLVLSGCSDNQTIENNIQIQGRTTNNENFNSLDFMGTPIIINFWYPSCPPCVKEIPTLVQTSERYENKILILGIIHNSFFDSEEDRQNMIDKFNVHYPNIFDEEGEIFQKFNIVGFPSTIFLDNNHEIIEKWTGFLSEENLDKYAEEMMQ